MFPVILAIESSCDETSAAVFAEKDVLSNVIASQDVHASYGGVVPELASRAHQQNIIPVVAEALKNADLEMDDVDAIAFTQGPGLLGSLLVGTTFAKALSLSRKVPLIAVNHMQAHITAHFIEDPKPTFPFLCLTVSGGHTQIIQVNDHLDMTIIGETQDDAVGEAFDKAAKMLGLPYPGGPLIDKLAAEGDPETFSFPKTDVPHYNYSFSGIKTALLYFLRDNKASDESFVEDNMQDICASYQQTLIDMLLDKLLKASKDKGINEIAIAGGVSANSLLRRRVKEMEEVHQWQTFIPKLEYCTDNAAMIAMNAYYKFMANDFADFTTPAVARLKF